MRRIHVGTRPDWRERLDFAGCTYFRKDPAEDVPIEDSFWREEHAYEFTAAEVDAIEAATGTLHELCLAAVDAVARDPALMSRFGLGDRWSAYARRSWDRGEPALMGRFDLAYDPATGAMKMLEYNADTPTLAIETALVQWHWLQDTNPGADQFNSMEEALLARLAAIKAKLGGATLHFSAPKSEEEECHAGYFRELAERAGIPTAHVALEDIGWAEPLDGVGGGWFVDLENRRIRFCHKMTPWEWLRPDPLGERLPEEAVGWIEPPWKMLLSNKAILPILWEMFPGHPNLLEAHDEPGRIAGPWVSKPILAREGANITFHDEKSRPTESTGGPYSSRLIYQAQATLPDLGGGRVVLGSWIVGDEPCGMIVREADGMIVKGGSRTVPHLFR